MSTPLLKIKEISQAQSGKYITHNEGLRHIEAVVIRADKFVASTLPTGTEGAIIIRLDDKTINYYYNNFWHVYDPTDGIRLYIADLETVYLYKNSNWVLWDGSGAVTLLALNDVLETTYIGNENKLVKVNSLGTGTVFSGVEVDDLGNLYVDGEINPDGETTEFGGSVDTDKYYSTDSINSETLHVLGGNADDYVLSKKHTHLGNVNTFKINEWLYRQAAGSDFTTVEVFNGISIDTSYNTPLTSKTWWRRDPQIGKHSFGNDIDEYLAIDDSGIKVTGGVSTDGGANYIKHQILRGTWVDGADLVVPHGLDLTKIIGWTLYVSGTLFVESMGYQNVEVSNMRVGSDGGTGLGACIWDISYTI